MTTPAAHYVFATQSSGAQTAPSGTTVTAPQVGDLAILFENTSGAPTALTGKKPLYGNGPNSGSDASYTAINGGTAISNGASPAQAAIAWYKVLVSGDFDGSGNLYQLTTVTEASGSNRTTAAFITHANGFDSATCLVEFLSHTALSGAGTIVSPQNKARPQFIIGVYDNGGTSVAAQTWTWDGGTARTPYFNTGGNTTTDGVIGHNYGYSSNFYTGDFNYYDVNDTPATVALSSGLGVNHMALVLNFQAKLGVFSVSASDTVGVVDSITGTTTKLRAFTDTVGVSDTVSGGKSVIRTFNETVGVTETVSTFSTRARALTDTIGLTAIAGTKGSIHISDNVGVTATASKTVTELRSLTNTVGVSNSIGVIEFRNIITTDTIGINATVKTGSNLSLALSNSVGIVGVCVLYGYKTIQFGLSNPTTDGGALIAYAEKATLSDIGEIQLNLLQDAIIIATSPWMTLTGTIQKYELDLITGITDPANLSALIAIRTPSHITPIITQVYLAPSSSAFDTVGIRGALSPRVLVLRDNLLDRVGIGGVFGFFTTHQHIFAAGFEDIIGISAQVIDTVVESRGIIDTVGVIATEIANTGFDYNLFESVDIIDQVSTASALTLPITNTVGVVGVMGTTLNRQLFFADTVDISEIESDTNVLIRTATNSVGIVASLGTQLTANRAFVDSVNITDAITPILGRTLTVSNSVGIFNTFAEIEQGAGQASFLNTIGIRGNARSMVGVLKALVDLIGISDTATLFHGMVRGHIDRVDLTEIVSTHVTISRTLLNVIGISEIESVVQVEELFDQIGISNSISFHAPQKILETVGISETLSIELQRVVVPIRIHSVDMAIQRVEPVRSIQIDQLDL